MKGEKITYADAFGSSKDMAGQVMDQSKLVRQLLTLKKMDSSSYIILEDAILTWRTWVKSLGWNNNIEKEWNKALNKLESKYPKLENGSIHPRLSLKYRDDKFHIDAEFLSKMSLDIGIIDRKIASNENSKISES